MKDKKRYSYVILRYIHDTMGAEFVNVGLLFLSSEERFLHGKTKESVNRFKHLFPNIDASSFRESMKSIQRGMDRSASRLRNELPFSEDLDASIVAEEILPRDDSSLQWSEARYGLCPDSRIAFDRLYKRYVSRYDEPMDLVEELPHLVSNKEIWRDVVNSLHDRNISIEFSPKVVEGKSDSIEFKHAYKNGQWHAYEPLSFDMKKETNIKDKARRWRGHLEAVADGSDDDIRVNFIVHGPKNKSLNDAYESAIEILKGSPFETDVFRDSQLERIVEKIEADIHDPQNS